jgi:hypothetical protein
MMGQAEGKTVFAASGPPPTFYGYVGRSDWFVPPSVAYYDMKDKLG